MTKTILYTLSILALTLSHAVRAATYAGVQALYNGDDGYDTERLAYNRRFDLFPYAITYPSTANDVSAIVKQGAQDNLQIVARSGQHSYIANSLGGKNGALVVDMKNFTNITIDDSTFNAIIEPGNRLGDVATALNTKGRALPHGTCPYVGIGGHSSFGGFGFTSRMWGLTLDNIISSTIVLANGTVVTASETENSDLFWAIRGAAPSFGIVVSATFKTYAEPEYGYTYSFQWDLSANQAANALLSYQNFTTNSTYNIPAYYGGELTLGKGSSSGRISFELIGQWFADSSAINSTLAPFLETMPSPSSYYLHGGTYIAAITDIGGGSLSTAAADTSDTFYAKSLMTPQASLITYNAAYAFMNNLATTGYKSDLNWFIEFELYGGQNSAINAIPVDSTAFARRDSLFTVQMYASSSTFQPPYPSSGFTFLDNLFNDIINNSPSDWNYGMYTNYVEDKIVSWQVPYYDGHYSRLQSIKTAVDPDNVFHFETSIQEA